MVEVTFSEPSGTTTTLVDETRWSEVVEENRPYLDPGTVIEVRNKQSGIIYGETRHLFAPYRTDSAPECTDNRRDTKG